MHWEVFGTFEVYVNDLGRIQARISKQSRGFGAVLTPVDPPKDFDGFLGFYLTPEQAKAAIERWD
jgi:hypothetical protein